jgi:hypothetical protein
MTETRRVPGPSSPLSGNEGRLIAVIVVAVLVAIVKPWDVATAPAAQASRPTSTISVTAAPTPTEEPVAFDFRSFQGFEPPPAWELWPAGNLVSSGFAMRIDTEPAEPGPSGHPAASPSPGAPGSPPPGSSPAPPTPRIAPSSWPQRMVITSGSRLYLLGLNRPLETTVRIVDLVRYGDDGSTTPMSVVLLPSPWPDHFTILAMGSGDGTDRQIAWPPGRYRLDTVIDPGGIERSIEILIDAPTEASPAPSPVPGPTGPASPGAQGG